MTLLDRFRTQPPQKHPDAAVRLQYVGELPLSDRQTIAAMAREDEDPRVRRAAVAKLIDPPTLGAIARDDTDPDVRAQAATMLHDIAVEAFEDTGEAEGLEAVEAIAEPRVLAQVAKTAQREITALRALTRVDDPRLLGSIARHAVVEGARRGALDSLQSRGERAELVATAMNSDFKDTAVAAVDVLSAEESDEARRRELLEQVADKARNKSASKRARGILREAEEQAARQAAARDAETRAAIFEREAARAAEARAARDGAANERPHQPQVDRDAAPEAEAEAVTPPHGDPLAPDVITEHDGDAQQTAHSEQAVASSAVVTREHAAADAHEHADDRVHEPAGDRAHEHVGDGAHEHAGDVAHDAGSGLLAPEELARRTARLSELADEAGKAIGEPDFAAARKRFAAIRHEWRGLSNGVEVDAALLTGMADLDARFAAREAEARDADARARKDALARMHNLLGRVEPLTTRPDLSLKAGDRALRDVRTTLAAMPMLPTKQDYDDVRHRLQAAQSALTPRVQELREADDWRRFANVAIQEQLCARMEALQGVEDPEVISREVRALQQQWRDAADVPRAQADALWRRFKAAHDLVWPRVESHFAVQAEERAANLQRKVALCERAEALSDSTNWIQTAEAIKALQAEWKTIGPVSRGKEKAIWERFRSACDRFFRRRHEDLAERKAVWSENLKKKEALCERAEALAQSTDWEAAAADIKRLQAEWKTVGPVKKSRSETIWQRFRAACDTFFDRYAHRHDTARAERAAAREALVSELESLTAERAMNTTAEGSAAAQAEGSSPAETTGDAAAGVVSAGANDAAIAAMSEGAVGAASDAAAGANDAAAGAMSETAARPATDGSTDTSSDRPAEAGEAPPDLLARVRAIRNRYQQELAQRGVDPDRARALDERFGAALNRVLARWPAAFAGTELDPDANRKRMESLVKKMEDLAASLSGAAAADETVSPTTRLAAMLKEALAANTIGGKPDEDSRYRAAAEEVRQAQSAWSRIGLVPEDVRRPLVDRFQRAVRRISERTTRSAAPRGNSRRGSSPA